MRILFYSAWGYVDWNNNCVGIYGLDLMVDSDLKAWLIEVNKSPCLAYTTHVTSHLVPLFLEDLAKAFIDKTEDTGDLELLVETPCVHEPVEARRAEEFTVYGQRLVQRPRGKK